MKLRIPLRAEVSADDVDNAFNDNDWALDQAVIDDLGRPIFKRWSAADSTSVHYICDDNVGLDYILIAGEAAEATARRITKQLSSWSAGEVRAYADWASAREDLIIALHLIGLIGGEAFDADLYRHLERGSAHEDPEVRRAAMLAASYLHWPEVSVILQGAVVAGPENGVQVSATSEPPASPVLDGDANSAQ